MAPSSGQVLVPQAVKAFKYMVSKSAAYLRARLSQEASTAGKQVGTIPIRLRQPLHPVAALRQRATQQRNFSTAIRRVISGIGRPVQAARPIAGNSIRSAISKSNFAPFSSPLRPNLTGGAIPRTSGGYTLGGGGARHFSSTPAIQAHVVQNVNAAVRAFCLNGYKVQYDGTDSRTGAKKFRSVSAAQEKALNTMRKSSPVSKGTTLEFRIAPTITAISALDDEVTLESEKVLSGLASDFSKSLSCLSMVHTDLKKLAALGSLPISYPNPHTLHVRFAGCDASIVRALCNELGIQRGVVQEDPQWSEETTDKDVGMALLFPWAPSQTSSDLAAEALFSPASPKHTAQNLEWQDMILPISEQSADEFSHGGFSLIHSNSESGSNPWQSLSYTPSYDALRDSDVESNEELTFGMTLTQMDTMRPVDASAYEGMEGVLRFIEQCDTSHR